MSEIVSPLLEWLNANPEWAGFATFLISTAESVAIIGTIIPGTITMTAIGALAGAGVIPLWSTLIWAILGAIVGDGISYWLGFYFKERLHRVWPFNRNPIILEKGEMFVHRFGIMSVFIGRFVGPVRALVPMVAGMLGMKPLQFSLANIASAIGWAPIYMAPGILIGAASKELPPDIAIHVILVLFLIALFISLCLWVVYKTLKLISGQTERGLVRIWQALKRSRYFHYVTVILKHHDEKEHHGQLILAFYFTLATFAFFALVSYVKLIGASHIAVNDTIYHFFRGIRTEKYNDCMFYLTLFGQGEILFPTSIIVAVWLFLRRHYRAALHLLALCGMAFIGIYLLKHAIASLRPIGIIYSTSSYSMPSAHATLAAAIYMTFAFFFANAVQQKRRWLIYTPTLLLIFAVSVSRLYLGAHWFTDIIAGWLLAASLCMLMILSFKRERIRPLPLLHLLLISVSTLIIVYAVYYHQYFSSLSKKYAEIDWPTKTLASGAWWQQDGKGLIDAERVSLFGFASQNINIEWAGQLSYIHAELLKTGWHEPPARDWISTLHRISDINSSEYLPMVSPQYLDKKPELILAKRADDGKKLLVLRLWKSYRILDDKAQTPLYVGTIGIVPRSYGWLFKKHSNLEQNPNLILNDKAFGDTLNAKMISVPYQKNQKLQSQQVLLLKSSTLRVNHSHAN